MGRAVSAVLCATLYVAFGLLTPSDAFGAISLPTLTLLTGCMLLSTHAEKQGLYEALSAMLLQGNGGQLLLLVRLSIFTAILSALITNDSACLLLPPLVLKACRARGFSPRPFLIAVATSANIGSACTPIGNPQNMVIASASGVPFRSFLAAIGLASTLALALNVGVIVVVFRGQFFSGAASAAEGMGSAALAHSGGTGGAAADAQPPGAGADCAELLPQAAARSSLSALDDSLGTISVVERESSFESVATPSQSPERAHAQHQHRHQLLLLQGGGGVGGAPPSHPQTMAAVVAPAAATPNPSSGWHGRGLAVRCILCALPIALVLSDVWIGLGWLVLLAAMLCFLADGVDPAPLLEKVDSKLLFFFSGLFVSVAGLNSTGIPSAAFDAIFYRAQVTLGGLAELGVFSLTVLVGSNTVSNVPLVLLLAPKLALPSVWLVLAWVSTVAGNLVRQSHFPPPDWKPHSPPLCFLRPPTPPHACAFPFLPWHRRSLGRWQT